jgi:hypothetical protein
VVGDAIEQGGGHFGVAKNRDPFGKRQIRGDDQRGLFVRLSLRCLLIRPQSDSSKDHCSRCGVLSERDGPGCLDSFPRTISGVLPGLVSLPYRAWDGGRA